MMTTLTFQGQLSETGEVGDQMLRDITWGLVGGLTPIPQITPPPNLLWMLKRVHLCHYPRPSQSPGTGNLSSLLLDHLPPLTPHPSGSHSCCRERCLFVSGLGWNKMEQVAMHINKSSFPCMATRLSTVGSFNAAGSP